MVFQIILQLEGIVLKVIGIILQQNIMGMYVPFVISLCFDQCPASHLPDCQKSAFVVIVKVVQCSD